MYGTTAVFSSAGPMPARSRRSSGRTRSAARGYALTVKRALLLALLAALLATGCGGDDEPTAMETDTATTPVESVTVKVYWLLDGKVWPTARHGGDILFDGVVMDQLVRGPKADERELGLETALPEDA